ncbi:hypothetical protein ACT6P6_02055 [Priestia endophytica]
MKISLKALLTQLILFFTGVLVFLILFIDSNLPVTKSFLPLLPMVFTIGCIIFPNIYFNIYKNLATTIIVFTYYIRLVLVPFFMKFSDYNRNGIIADTSNTFNAGITLMVFEYFTVFLVLSIFCRKFSSRFMDSSFMELRIPSKIYRATKLVLWVVTLYILMSIFLYPNILNNYKFFVFLSEEQSINWYRNYNIAQETVPIFIFYTSTWAINIVKNIWILILILKLSKKKKKGMNLVFSVGVIVLNALISSGDTAYSLYFSLAFLIILVYLYPNKKRVILLFTCILVLVVAVLGLLSLALGSAKSSVSPLFNISNTLQAYFNGPINVAAALMIDGVRGHSLIIADFFTSLPLLRTFFMDMTNSTAVFNQIMYGMNSAGGQILPSISLGKLYFGYLLSPLLSCLFTYYAMKYSYKAFTDNRLPYKFLYQFISIILACIPVLYNFYIFLIGLFTYILPVWLLVIMMTKRVTYKR